MWGCRKRYGKIRKREGIRKGKDRSIEGFEEAKRYTGIGEEVEIEENIDICKLGGRDWER